MNMREMARDVLDDNGYLKKGWEVQNSSILICPCGHRIEWDGKCPDGCVSPLRELAMI